nr:uncharacterized protein LOC128702051 [Cherax quadricarinatus]
MDKRRTIGSTDVNDRATFIWMWENGSNARAIARDTGSSVTTVRRWINRWKKEGNVNTKPRSGRPRRKPVIYGTETERFPSAEQMLYFRHFPRQANFPLAYYSLPPSFTIYSKNSDAVLNINSTFQQYFLDYLFTRNYADSHRLTVFP